MTADPMAASSAAIPAAGAALPAAAGVLAVCAHLDDESFGLGAVLAAFTDAGVPVAVLCFTHGEASTLHAAPGELAAVRAEELTEAAAHLGVGRAELLGYPDDRLGGQPVDELAGHVRRLAEAVRADTLLVFDVGGITGHPDHQRATEAALAAASGGRFSVLAWALPDTVARTLNAEFGTAFVGRTAHDIDIVLPVDRRRQLAAVHLHASQSTSNPVLWRRLELQGNLEWLRRLPTDGGSTAVDTAMRTSAVATTSEARANRRREAFWAMSLPAVLADVRSDPGGLSEGEAARRLERNGPNTVEGTSPGGAAQRRSPAGLPARSPRVVPRRPCRSPVLDPDDLIDPAAMTALDDSRRRCLAVVRSGRVVGMLREEDVLELLTRLAPLS